jgi:hypothetical protein
MTLSLLDGDDCQRVLIAIDRYVRTGELPELEGKAAIAAESILETLVKAQKRYKAAKRNGEKGGRPSGRGAEGGEGPDFPGENLNPNQNGEKGKPNHNQNHNQNGNQNHNQNVEKWKPKPNLNSNSNSNLNLNSNINLNSKKESLCFLGESETGDSELPGSGKPEDPKNIEEGLETPENGENRKTHVDPDSDSVEGPSRSNAGHFEGDATALFQKLREIWNSQNLKPECRDIIMPPSKYACLRTLQNYSPQEIENAMKNYSWHIYRCKGGYRPPPLYGSIYGFLESGVPRYYKDEDFKVHFKEPGNGH